MYRIGGPQARYNTFRETLTDAFAAPFRRAGRLLRGQGSAADLDQTFWALKDVNFEVKRGEVVGIIGRNGAGKSTLLKILSRITEPTEGAADIYGRVGSLLEVGTGFHPELSGRENIYLNGAILGMRRAEIDRKLDEIVAFAEIEKFLDTPVKHYSSGMYVRLAFAVAAHLEPEILLVDEVLAVGDAAFQQKCLGKIDEVAAGGRTVLFVSHNLSAILGLCARVIWLDQGRIMADSETGTALEAYLREHTSREARELAGDCGRRTGAIRIMKRVAVLQNGRPTATIQSGGSCSIEVLVLAESTTLKHFALGVVIKDATGQRVLTTNMQQNHLHFQNLGVEQAIRVTFTTLPLSPGTYSVSLYLGDGKSDLDIVENAIGFDVVWAQGLQSSLPPKPNWGPLSVPARWGCT